VIPLRARLAAAFFVLLATSASADRQSGSIAGTVTEAGGGRLRGVTVTLTGSTGSVTATTGTGGDYRFPALTPGRYDIKAELAGFQARRVESLTVSIARDVAIDFALTVAGPSETVEVVEEAPATLPTTSSVDNLLTQDLLFNMPFERLFFDLPLHAPGIDERAFGAPVSAVLQDGVETRSPEDGSLYLYLSYNWVEEVQIAGLGAPAEYGGYTGAVINSITRSGGNGLSGLFDVLYTSKGLVSDNLTDELVRENPGLENRAVRSKLFDITAQVGGPIVRDKLFFFAGVERRLGAFSAPQAPVDERTVEPKLLAKLTYVPGPRDQFVGVLEADDFDQTGLGVGSTLSTSEELAANFDAPELVWNGQWRHSFGARTSGEIKYTGWTSYTDRFPTTDKPRHYDGATGDASGSAGVFNYRNIARNQLNASVSRYAEGFGKHDLKFGLEIERSHVSSRFGYTGGFYYYDYGGPYLAYSNGYEISAHNSRDAVYAQDSWRIAGRLTVDAGLRLDWIRGTNPELGKLYDVWNLQPRIGFNLDPTGTGRWLLKAHWGRYHEGALTAIFKKALPGVDDYVAYAVEPDGTPGDEVSRIPYRAATIDPEIRHPRMDEFIAGADAALPLDLRLSVTGVWRDNHKVVGLVEPGTRYVPVTFTNALTGEDVTTYAPQSSDGTPLLTNPAGFQYLDPAGNVVGTPEPNYKYRGLMIVCRRPYVDRWQAQVSYVWSKTTGTVESNLSNLGYYFFLQFAQPRPHALINLEGELGLSEHHEVKAMVSYRVPKLEVGLNAYFRAQSGGRYTPLQRFHPFDPGPVYIAFPEPRGSRELPWRNRLDLRIEKIIARGGDRIGLFADITNVFNAGTVTAVDPFTGETFEQPLELLGPRQVVLGARWSF
jgi:hypothetical protein